MIIRTHSFDNFSRYFQAKTEVDPADEIELLPMGRGNSEQDHPVPECKLSKIIARQHCERARNKIVADLSAPKAGQTSRTVTAGALITQEQTLNLLKKISALLLPEVGNPEIGAMLNQLISAVSDCSQKQIPPDLMHSMSHTLGYLATRLDGLPALRFIQLTILNLQQVCRYSWLRLTYDALVQMFAREIEQQVVANPTLADVETTRLSLEVSLPVPLLSVGGEINYVRSRSVDDEGNYVTSTGVTGGLTCKISALFASAKAKALGNYSRYAYFKTAEDHARYFFTELLEQNKRRPVLAPLLSFSGAAGIEELKNFDQIQQTYLLQQAHYSQSFSVLLGLKTANQEQAAQSEEIILQAVPDKHIRGTKGVVKGGALSAEGYAGALLLQAGLSARGKHETRRTQRVLTLCELIGHRFGDGQGRAKITRRIRRASIDVRQKAFAFWYPHAGDKSMQAMQRHITCLTADWEAYAHMHAAHVQGHATTDAVLGAFHKKYGAKNTEDCLRRMALMVAALYIELLEQEPGDETQRQKSVLLSLEQAMHHSSIPGARRSLAKHALARQRIEYSSDENVVQFTVGEAPPMGGTAPGVKITSRTLHHHNCLRAGEYVTVELALGSNLGANQRAVKSLADYFSLGPTGLGSFFGSGSYVQCGVHTVRFFRPAEFAGLPFSKQYERRTEQRGAQIGATVPIPVAGIVNLQAGLHHSRTSTQFVSETPGTGSVLYFAMHRIHALSSGKTRMNGEKVQDSYWDRIEREQQAALEQLFLNYARDARDQGGLVRELDVIEQTLAGSNAQLQQLRAGSSVFLAATMQLEQERSAENYQTALAEFKALWCIYYPLWLAKKEASKAYKEWEVALP